MTGFTDHHPRLPVLCALLIVLILGACGGEDEPPPPTATATPTTTQAATVSPPAPTATATAPPATANPAAVAELPVDIDSETRWREVYDALSVGERTCIRDALGAELFESALSRPVVNEGEAEQWEVDAYACLDPPTARSLLLAAELTPMLEDAGAVLTADQAACMREATAEVDAPAIVAADLPEGDPGPAAAFYEAIARCLPGVLVDALIAEMGTDGADLGDAERSCLLEWVAGVDWLALEAEEEDPEGYGAVLASFVRCVPDAFMASLLADMGVVYEELPGEPRACLREWLLALDWAETIAGASGDSSEPLDAALARCTADLADDHADALEGATAVTVGVAIDGTLEISYDEDVFSFEAEQGEVYEIDVEPGTLDDPWLELLDVEGMLLDRNDDSADSLAARLVWEAPDSARYYVKVGGWGGGTYQLMVAVSDLADDHGGSISSATPVRIGAAIEGAIEHLDDTDRFSFEAVAGWLYQVEVMLGTLYDSWVEVQNADGSLLAWNDDTGPSFASRIIWEAPASDRYYVEVGGWTETGSYTLSVLHNAKLEADRATLLKVRDALRGDAPLNWSGEVPIAQWEGVLLDGAPARVRGLFLEGRGLSGVIPPELGALSGLGALNLRNNALTGTIPPRLSGLGGLFVLLLMNNELSGEIPAELGDLARLEVLDLGSNRLSGEIPAALGSLGGLRELSLDSNDLSGPIPPELGRLASLEELWLGHNRLSGDVPAELADLASLAVLSLAGNELSGCVPDSLEDQLLLYEHGRLLFCSEAAERENRAEAAPRDAALPPDSLAWWGLSFRRR